MSNENLGSDTGAGDEIPRMPKATRYAGESVDVSSRHSINIRRNGNTNVLIDPHDNRVVVDHFFHEGVFWRAIIPVDGVNQVFGQAFNFSKIKTRPGANGPETVYDRHGMPKRKIRLLNHLQSRFTLKPDHFVELYPLGGDPRGTPTHQVDDFVYSVEAVGPLGIGFSLRDGLQGNLISAHRFLSTREMVFERLVVENQYVTESPALPLEDSEKRVLLTQSLLRSHRAGMTEVYYLFRVCGTNNCTSNPFQILDNVVRYRLVQRIGSSFYRLPLNPRFYLRIRGMDSDPSVRKLVRNEFEVFIRDPETQQRKRDYVRGRTRALRAAREARNAKE